MNKNTVNKYLRKFGFEVHGLGYLQSLAKGEFKKDSFAAQCEILGDEDVNVIFDVGANHGDVFDRYRRIFKGARIYAFEPFKESFDHLAGRFKGDANCEIIQMAVSDCIGEKVFFVNQSADTNSLLMPQKVGLSSDRMVENKSSVVVCTIDLESFCRQRDINKIDILKMDIQGGEYNALLGSKELLSQGRVRLLYLETFFVQQYHESPLFHDISKLLFDWGYVIQDIYSPFYGNNKLAWADAIFIKSK